LSFDDLPSPPSLDAVEPRGVVVEGPPPAGQLRFNSLTDQWEMFEDGETWDQLEDGETWNQLQFAERALDVVEDAAGIGTATSRLRRTR
jgi:hypothetical protein